MELPRAAPYLALLLPFTMYQLVQDKKGWKLEEDKTWKGAAAWSQAGRVRRAVGLKLCSAWCYLCDLRWELCSLSLLIYKEADTAHPAALSSGQ